MARRRKDESAGSLYQIFSDVAFLTLITMVFLLVMVLMSARNTGKDEVPELKKEIEKLQSQLQAAADSNERLSKAVERALYMEPDKQVEAYLEAAGVGKKDFDLFVKGLKDMPGRDVHLIVDATGSMHGVSGFLVPVLRLVITRAGKQLSALTWYADNTAKTLTGTMGQMFDGLVAGAPFAGSLENIGRAFRVATQTAPAPGAYLLVGDEASDDTISYTQIPSPVFTMPIGISDAEATREYKTLADKTGGKLLQLDFH